MKKFPFKHKFNAKRTEIDEIKFSSKLEAAYYKQLKQLKERGDVLFFLRQVPFHLPGNVRYVIDFVVFYAEGYIDFVETKGLDTPLAITKRKLVESLYPITINVVKKTSSLQPLSVPSLQSSDEAL